MSPAGVARVFLVAVLGVVQQHVGAVRQFVPADPVGRLHAQVEPGDAGFVIREIHHRLAVFLDAVPDRWALVRHERRADRETTHGYGFRRRVVEREGARDVADAHREQRR
jgi:hypothetical protein